MQQLFSGVGAVCNLEPSDGQWKILTIETRNAEMKINLMNSVSSMISETAKAFLEVTASSAPGNVRNVFAFHSRRSYR